MAMHADGESSMSAPRKVSKIQLVRIQPMQSLTSSIEATIALQEATNVMKYMGRFIMGNSLMKARFFSLLTVSCFFLGIASAVEVEGRVGERNLHQQHTVFNARLSPLQECAEIYQADNLVLHVECGDFRTIHLMQKPFYKIDLAGEDITSDKLNELLPICSQVLALNLMETSLKDKDIHIIAKITGLESLILSDNQLGDEAISSIALLGRLKHLEIVHTKITDTGLKSLLALKMLEKLDAGCNLVKNGGVETISRITSLVDVDVRACEFDETALPFFLNLPKLKRLNISGNRIKLIDLKAFLDQAKERGIEVKAEDIL